MSSTELWIDTHGIEEVLQHYDMAEHKDAIYNLAEDILCLKEDIEILKGKLYE